MKMKKSIAILLTIALLFSFSAFTATADTTPAPVLSYTFEDDCAAAPTLFGNAQIVFDNDKCGNVLSLDGTSGTYAELPQGFFDGRDTMTILFDVLTLKQNSYHYFTFTFGQNNQKYDFFRVRDGEIRNCVTVNSWENEKEVITTRSNFETWISVAIVIDGTTMKLYANGQCVSENSNTGITVSDLGSNLLSYFGKSLYDGDGYFCGLFDNFEVYEEVLSATRIADAAAENVPVMPVLRYTFEDNALMSPTLYGNAAITYDSDKKSKVLSLDGTSDTYAEIPQGFFDARDTMTVLMDIQPLKNSGNYFTFTFGTDTQKYDFLRIRGTEVRNAITVDSYGHEREVRTDTYTDGWIHVGIVFDSTVCRLYVNGNLVSENGNTGITVSDLGSNLLSYIGKSIYSGDGYFNGYFDNVEVYDTVLEETAIRRKAVQNLPLLIGVTVGVTEENISARAGTDSHTMIETTLNRTDKTITSLLQRRQNLKAVPVKFYLLGDNCTVTVDGKPSGATTLLDMTRSHSVTIQNGDTAESYTLQASSTARNPVLPGMYADPDIDVLDGKFWIYPTTDGHQWWSGTQFHAFSSVDMVHWTDEGVILDVEDKTPGTNANGVQIAASPWSDGSAWAPAIEEKDGKYYFYYCGRIKTELLDTYAVKNDDGNYNDKAIGVAWADAPEGPYTAADAPILYPKQVYGANFGYGGQIIDPSVFTDDDGTSYLLFGNGSAAMATLNSDMKSVDTSTFHLFTGLTDFRESVAVFKRNGLYYFHWSCDDTGSENYHIKYGIASSLTGSISNYGVLLEKDTSTGILATGHQSILYLPESDRCFIAYHRFYTPLSVGGCVGDRRETCLNEIYFNGNTLQKVTPTMAGVAPMDVHGHNISETVVQPTCTEDGSITGVCTAGETSIILTKADAPELAAAGHHYLCTATEVSCTQDGYCDYDCTLCDTSYRGDFTPAFGHDITFARGNTGSEFTATCSRGDVNETYDFGAYAGARENTQAYDAILDVNQDGIINGRDLAYIMIQVKE